MRKSETIEKFTTELLSQSPTPGGGGAAALSGALGVSLVAMVSSLSIEKKSLAEHSEEHGELLKLFSNAQQLFLSLMDQDEESFKKLMSAYSLKKQDPQRKEQIVNFSIEAAGVPLTCLKTAVSIYPHALRVSEIGNKNVFSDIACGIHHLDCCYHSSLVNIAINIGALKDDARVQKILKQVEDQKALFEKSKLAFSSFLKSYTI